MTDGKKNGAFSSGAQEKKGKAPMPKLAVAVPNWKGPAQAPGASAAGGDPFVHSSKLDSKAAAFVPAKPSPIKFAMTFSESDAASSSSKTGRSDNMAEMQVPTCAGAEAITTPEDEKDKAEIERLFTPKIFTSDIGEGLRLPGGHYIRIDNIAYREIEAEWKEACDELNFEAKVLGCIMLQTEGADTMTFYACFDDMRDAASALQEINERNSHWMGTYIHQAEYAAAFDVNFGGGLMKQPTELYDGQVMVTGLYAGIEEAPGYHGLYGYLKAGGELHGRVLTIEGSEIAHQVLQFRMEFQSITAAKSFASELSTMAGDCNDWRLLARDMISPPPKSGAVSPKTKNSVTVVSPPQKASAAVTTPQKLAQQETGMRYNSPTGRTAWKVDANGNKTHLPGNTQLPKCQSIPVGVSMVTPNRHNQMRESDPAPQTPAAYIEAFNVALRSQSWPKENRAPASPTVHPPRTGNRRPPPMGPNRIDEDRILEGVDVRTTVMLRNIPHEMTLDLLTTEVLDLHVKGRYSFVYLRFDFARNQNVGYAFVDLIDPEDVLTIYRAIEGQEYIPGMGHTQRYGPRRGEVAYATCQGQDCAIEKFRNSSVMCENPDFRPTLFWTVNDAPEPALVGKSRAFPGVNNVSKHNRSKDNATQIGLYAPKSRQGGATMRNSQFDRGTPRQVTEDASYHQQQQMSPYGTQYGFDMNHAANGQSNMQMPVMPPQPVFYAPFYGAPATMASPPTPNYHYPGQNAGFPSPTPHRGGFAASRLRTITQGRLGNGGRRRQNKIHPGRDLETAIREVAENKRIEEEYDARVAAAEAAAAEAQMQSGEVPRYFDGEEMGAAGYSGYDGGVAITNGNHSNSAYAGYTFSNTAPASDSRTSGNYANGASSRAHPWYNPANYET